MGKLIDFALEKIRILAQRSGELTEERRAEIMEELLKEADEITKDDDDE